MTSYYKDFIENNEGKSFIEFSKTLIDNLMAKQKFSKRNRLKWIEHLDESKLKGYNFVQSIHYHSGIFALNINRKNNLIPLILSNTPVSKKGQAKDYRFASGVKGVNFIWPDPLKKESEFQLHAVSALCLLRRLLFELSPMNNGPIDPSIG